MPIFPRHRHLPDLASSGHPASAIGLTAGDLLTSSHVQGLIDEIPQKFKRTGERPVHYYVALDGNDSNDGLSPERPLRTFAAALNASTRYDLVAEYPVDWDDWTEDWSWFVGSGHIVIWVAPGVYYQDWNDPASDTTNNWIGISGKGGAAKRVEIRSLTRVASDVEIYGVSVFGDVYLILRDLTFHSLYCTGPGYAEVMDCRILFDGDGCGLQARDAGIIYAYGTIDLIASDPTPEHQFWAPFSAGYQSICVAYNGCIVNLSGAFKTAQCSGIAYAYARGFVFFRGTTFNIAPGTVLPKQATVLNGGEIQSNSHTIATFPGNGAPTIDDLGSSFLGRTRQKELIVPTVIDANGNEILKTTNVASAVNEITISNAATGNSPSITTSGGDSNISLTMTPKGTGKTVITRPKVSSAAAPTSATAAGEAGEVRFDSNYLYYCVAADSWKRAPLAAW